MSKTEQEIRNVIAKNLVELRKRSGLTQSEVAEKINYSDKSVSKWERAEGVPDVYLLSQLAEIYSVAVADFFCDEPVKIKTAVKRASTKTRILITALSVGIVWLVATIMFFVLSLVGFEPSQISVVYFVGWPISAIVLTVFTAIWFPKIATAVSVSMLVWSVAIGIDIYLPLSGAEQIYFVATAMQVLVSLWYLLVFIRSREKKKQNNM
jgi:transcriptional regulator with XRE-family HTH domain